MNQNDIVQKIKGVLEIEIALAEQQVAKDPFLADHLLELLEVQKFVNHVKGVPLIYG